MFHKVSTHMPLARHDRTSFFNRQNSFVSTHMPLARHDLTDNPDANDKDVSTHMPLARHDDFMNNVIKIKYSFYSHASCEA